MLTMISSKQQQQQQQVTIMKKKIVLSMIMYMIIFGLAYMASIVTFQMQQYVLAVSMNMQKALRLTAVHMLEATESIVLHQQASYNKYQAQVLQEASLELEARGEYEHDIYEQQQRQRGEFLAKLAIYEQNKANIHWQNVQRDQELHDQIMSNLTLDTERHQETLTEIQNKKMHAASFCNMTTLFTSICNVIGGVTSLQEQSDHEALQIQKEWNNARTVNQDEVMEMTVAKMLQHQANEYNTTSQKLLAAATAWDERAQIDFEMSRQDHTSSLAYASTAITLENQALREEEWNIKSIEMVHTLSIQAHNDSVTANWKAIQGILYAVVVLIFIIPRTINKIHIHCTALATRQRPRPQHDMINNPSSLLQLPTYSSIGYVVSAFMAHVLIFLLILGSQIGNYLVSIQDYNNIHERAIIILWFAVVAATCHVLVLHGIRAVYTEIMTTNDSSSSSSSSPSNNNPTSHRDWYNVCWQLGKRLVIMLILFIMEILFCWLIMGNTLLFQPSVVTFLSTWIPFRLCALALLTWHVVCMDLEHFFLLTDDDHNDNEQEESTVWLSVNHCRNNNNNSATEATPLRKEEILSVTTPIDMYRSTEAPRAHTTTSISAAAAAAAAAVAAAIAAVVSGSDHHRSPPMMQEVEVTTGSLDDGTVTTLTANTLGFESIATTATTTTTTTLPPPRHYYSVYQGFSSLLLPLEIFVITCMVTIVSTDMQVVWHSQARIGQCLALVCVVVVLILACIMFQRWTTTIMGDDDDKMDGSWNEIMTASSSDIHGPLLSDHDHDDSYNVSSHKTSYSFLDSINPYKTGNKDNNNHFGIFAQPQKPQYELVAV